MTINLIVIKTHLLHQIKDQYEALGMSFSYHNHGKGPYHYASELNGVIFEIYPITKPEEKTDISTRLGFEVSHLNEILPQLENANWKILSLPKATPYGYTATIQDVDGRKVALTESHS
ncbi:glyoxalase/bleomycin resistance/extradiol dioxygenase family protein [Flavobacterium sp. J27]|uniref:glyoxalase/bleomycin resistance/extradiol dioxygenase family protein n=1 Tax=Flavobacterium sp. J27 TaxID=2060419 RepID=UPI00102F35F9|nr:glyoxalase/bleomycin resistance/extradiol dioxygenase family protein [Flavobacterium sp. J27]